MAVVVVGSANVDLVVNSPRFPKPGETLIGSRFEQLFGGKGANQAAAAALLGSPVRVVMRVGRDDLGQATRKNFERLGIDANRVVETRDAATGVALITVDANGENTIVVASGANAKLQPEDVAETVFDGAAVVLTQLEVPVATNIAALRKAKAKGVLTVFNAAPAPTEPLPDELWGLCDVICPNEPELQLLTGRKVETDAEAEEACGELLKRGVGAVLLTRGRRGCLLVRAQGSISVGVPEKLRTTPVDTTGAGDAFLGALAHLIASGSTLEAALPGAVEVASTSVRRRGAQASYPTAADLGWSKRPPAPPSPTRFGDSRRPSVAGALAAATAAVDQFVSSGSVVGIGCGSTVDHCVQLIAERLSSGALRDVTAMATSEATERRLREFGIPLLPPDSDKAVDVALTGCDGVSSSKDVVKGGKGAMLREKLVRAASSRWVVICDECKKSEGLGVDFPVPVEVAPAFHQRTLRRLAKLTGADARLRLGLAPAGRPGSDVSGKPFVTDNGNYVVDLFFREPLGDVWLMASSLDACPGAVEHGLFPASMRPDDPVVLVGRGDGGVERMELLGVLCFRVVSSTASGFGTLGTGFSHEIINAHASVLESGKQQVVEETQDPASPNSPTPPRVMPVDDGETSNTAAELQVHTSRGDEAPKSDGSVTSRDDDGDVASYLQRHPSLKREIRLAVERGREQRAKQIAASQDRAEREYAATCTEVMKGHTDRVRCLAGGCGHTGRLLASGGRDKSIIIWNVTNGVQLAKLEGHTDWVTSLAALDGDRLASGSSDESIIIWNLAPADRKQLVKLEGHTNEVNCLAALADGQLASGSRDKSIIIWNLASEEPLAKLEGHTDWVNCLAKLDGERLASGDDHANIIIWNLADGSRSAKLGGHTCPVLCLAALDGGRLASGGGKYDIGELFIWNLADGAQIAKLKGHTGPVYSLVVLDSDRLASLSDNTIRIWNVAARLDVAKDGKAPVVMWGQKGGSSCLVALDDGRLASGGSDGPIRIRPVRESSAAIRIAECGSAFEVEGLVRECHDNDALEDLLDRVDHLISHAKVASTAVTLQAEVFDAIAKVINEETDPAKASKSIKSLAPRIVSLVGDDNLLANTKRRGTSDAAIEKLASTAIIRHVVVGEKMLAGLLYALFFELALFLVLMFTFARVAGFEVLDWPKWFKGEENLGIVVAFVILAWFSLREIYQMWSTRALELAAADRPKEPEGLAGVLWSIPRLLVLFVACLPFLPVLLVIFGLQYAGKDIEDYKSLDAFGDWFDKNILNPIGHDPLTFLGLPRAWRRDHWNLTDAAMLGCCWAAFVRAAMPGTRMGANLAVVTTILLWIKVLAFVKSTTRQLAIFVAVMIDRIVQDLSNFLIFFGIIILMFACALYLYLGPRTRGDYDYHNHDDPTGYTTFPKTMLSLYLLGFVGEFEWDTFDTYALRALLCLFIFIVVIVLLNVLIAIVGKSYENAFENSEGIYLRLKMELIEEYAPIVRYLALCLRLSPDEESSTMKERLMEERIWEALRLTSDDAEVDPVRESQERMKKQLEAKIDAMEKKIDKLTEMLQRLLEKGQ